MRDWPVLGVADMRPALETCGRCHWPGHDSGDVSSVKREFADDEANTETVTRLNIRLLWTWRAGVHQARRDDADPETHHDTHEETMPKWP